MHVTWLSPPSGSSLSARIAVYAAGHRSQKLLSARARSLVLRDVVEQAGADRAADATLAL